jgi:hypothetical protein
MSGGRRLDLRKSTLVANLKKEKQQQQQRIQPKTMETSKNSKPITQTTSWPEKYHPRSCTEVVVPKKKAEVMIDFLEKQSSKTSKRPAVLFLVGPSGCGKCSTFVTLAKEKCFSVLEWKPPAPAIYNENVSTTNENRFDGGDAYTSKIEDFVNFLNRSTKYNAIVSNVIGGGNKRSRGTVILIRDVPTVAQGDERGRSKFVASIEGLVSSSAKNRIPVVFSSSSDVGEGDFVSFGNDSKSDGLKFVRRIIHEKLERMGAQNRQNLSEYLVEIKLNPCTKKSLEDAAKRVINLEFSSEMTKNGSFLESLPDEDDDFDGLSSIKSRMLENVENLVLECNGDVRSLTFSLQLLYARIVGDMYAKRKKNEKKNTKKRNREEARIDNADGDKERKKESSISLFHALGKFLYAKRKPSDDALESEVEITLNRARVDAAPKTVIDFLFENTPDFIDNRKIDALSQFLKHVSDADVFSCGSQRWKYGDGDQSQSLMLDRLASSVAARGCVSVQSRPPESSWRPLRAPSASRKAKEVEDSSRRLRELIWAPKLRHNKFRSRQSYYEGSFEAFVATNLPFKKIIEEGYRRNEDRIISDSLFTREDIDEMDNSLEDVEEEDIIEDVD